MVCRRRSPALRPSLSGPLPVRGILARRIPVWGILVLGFLALGQIPGCAPRPPALPAVSSDALPEAWLEALAERSCPEPFQARLLLRVEPRGRTGVTLDATLRTAPPDTLRLGVKLGAFKPLFALRADADSCQLLVHEEAGYWITSRESADWSAMNPSAWAEALGWALCPRDLFARLDPDGPGRVSGDLWRVAGVIRGTPYQVELDVDVDHGFLESLRIHRAGETLLQADLSRPRPSGGGWVPGRIDLEVPSEGMQILIQVRGVGSVDRTSLQPAGMLHPSGWRQVRGGLGLPVPEESGLR